MLYQPVAQGSPIVTGGLHADHRLGPGAVAVKTGEELLVAGGIVVKAQVGDQSAAVVHQGSYVKTLGYVNADVDSHWKLLSVWNW